MITQRNLRGRTSKKTIRFSEVMLRAVSNPGRCYDFFFVIVSRPDLGHTQPRIQCVPAHFPRW